MYEWLIAVVAAIAKYKYEYDPEYYWDRQHETFA